MKKTLVTLSALIFVAGPALAKDDYHVLGFGNSSCGTWAADKNNKVLRAADITWLQGYLTAFNRFGPEAPIGNITRGIDSEGLAGWIDNYCSVNPTDTINKAAGKLVLHLAATKPKAQ